VTKVEKRFVAFAEDFPFNFGVDPIRIAPLSCAPPDEIMVTGPGEAAELLRRREVPTPNKLKFFTRKRKLQKQNLKAGMQERVKRRATTWTD